MNRNERKRFNWDFIEKYYPNYYSCDLILLSDILIRKLTGEYICEKDEEFLKGWNIKQESKKLDKMIWQKAVENHKRIQF